MLPNFNHAGWATIRKNSFPSRRIPYCLFTETCRYRYRFKQILGHIKVQEGLGTAKHVQGSVLISIQIGMIISRHLTVKQWMITVQWQSNLTKFCVGLPLCIQH
jgi:hypothetical protein